MNASDKAGGKAGKQRSVNAQRVEDSRRRAILRGAISTPRGMLPPAAADALYWLRKHKYAASLSGAIARALIEAADREKHGAGVKEKSKSHNL